MQKNMNSGRNIAELKVAETFVICQLLESGKNILFPFHTDDFPCVVQQSVVHLQTT